MILPMKICTCSKCGKEYRFPAIPGFKLKKDGLCAGCFIRSKRKENQNG